MTTYPLVEKASKIYLLFYIILYKRGNIMIKNTIKKIVRFLLTAAIFSLLCLVVPQDLCAEEITDPGSEAYYYFSLEYPEEVTIYGQCSTSPAIAGVDTMATSGWSVSGETITIDNLNVNAEDYAEFCIWSGDKVNAGYGRGLAKLVIKGDCYIKTLVIDCPVEVTCDSGAKLVVGELVVRTVDEADGKLTYVGGATYNEVTKTFEGSCAHKYDTMWSKDVTSHWHTCIVCGDKKDYETHIKDTGTIVDPMCEVKGSITYKCTMCDAIIEVVEIPANEHSWDDGTITKEPTETTEGVKTFKCNNCNKIKTETIPKKEASKVELKNGDEVNDDKKSGIYVVTDATKKTVAFKSPVNKDAKTVTIPATIKVDNVIYKVTKIDDKAFKGNKKVTKITVGSNVTTIGKESFSGASKLKTVTIGKNVTEIGANAFKGCSSLTSITLPSKTTKIGPNVFSGCKKLITIKISSKSLTKNSIAKNAFSGLTETTSIKVPKKKYATYKRLFKNKGLSSKVNVIGY